MTLLGFSMDSLALALTCYDVKGGARSNSYNIKVGAHGTSDYLNAGTRGFIVFGGRVTGRGCIVCGRDTGPSVAGPRFATSQEEEVRKATKR